MELEDFSPKARRPDEGEEGNEDGLSTNDNNNAQLNAKRENSINDINLSLNFNQSDVAPKNVEHIDNNNNTNSSVLSPKLSKEQQEELLKERELRSRSRVPNWKTPEDVIKPAITSYVIGSTDVQQQQVPEPPIVTPNAPAPKPRFYDIEDKGLSELEILSQDLIPKQFLLNLEAEALAAASELGMLMTMLHSSMEKITGISVQSMSALSFSTDKLTESITNSVAQMNSFLLSCQELENNSKAVYELSAQILEIKKMLDKFELLIIKLIRPQQ